jgi:hypothetical protein
LASDEERQCLPTRKASLSSNCWALNNCIKPVNARPRAVADSGLDGACRFRQALRPTLEVRFLKAVPYRAFRGFQLNIPQIFLAFVVEHDRYLSSVLA